MQYREIVFIIILALYAIVLPPTALLWIRGFTGESKIWRPLLFFVIVRMLAAGFYIGITTDDTNISLWAGYATCLNIAVTMIYFTLVGIISYAIRHTSAPRPAQLDKFMNIGLSILIVTGLGLGVGGGIVTEDSWGDTGVFKYSALSQVSIGIFIGVFVIFVALTLYARLYLALDGSAEVRSILNATLLALVFVFIRIIYSAISVFSGYTSFNLIYGSTTILLCMALIEELVVVVIMIWIGFAMHKMNRHIKLVEVTNQGNNNPTDGTELGTAFEVYKP